MRFTYRVGRWQYWNHRHICDLFINRARAQHVSPQHLGRVVRGIYRVALNASFRRGGALFVLLRNRNSLRKMVVLGDAIGDSGREKVHEAFDQTLSGQLIHNMPLVLATELSSLDGGVVFDNRGRLLAYGAVLKTSRSFNSSEGSRTKAAISASHFGIAVKVSSDGDIGLWEEGKPFLEL
ncbi:MAG: hypothetical protein RL324_708 [Verrucomicrobiota bacterium]